jgi:hypothetical protein
MLLMLPELDALADLCRETADKERLQPWSVEKDFFLTRLIWTLAEIHGDRLLLKGGTCLSKCDLGYHRMSEDVDLVIPGQPCCWPGQGRTCSPTASANSWTPSSRSSTLRRWHDSQRPSVCLPGAALNWRHPAGAWLRSSGSMSRRSTWTPP